MRVPRQSQITDETVEDHREEIEKAKSDNAESRLHAEAITESAVGNFPKNLWNRAYHHLHVGMDLFQEFHKRTVPPLPGIPPIYAIENPHELSIRKRAFCMNVNLAYRILTYLKIYSYLSLMKFCKIVQDRLGIQRCSLQISNESLSLHFGPFNLNIEWKLQKGLTQTAEDPPRN
ncbi:uncharacterized protein LOC118185902 isoform X2 [Stegodyphus dumicola]|nr:uncharacterized protein LOC118185902 isoform X2 [Stegodyphus dumicola]